MCRSLEESNVESNVETTSSVNDIIFFKIVALKIHRRNKYEPLQSLDRTNNRLRILGAENTVCLLTFKNIYLRIYILHEFQVT